jgi:hemolysin III
VDARGGDDQCFFFSAQEEIANSVTHALGLLGSIVGGWLLLARALESSRPSHLVSAGVYGAALVTLYGASTLYHGCRGRRAKRVFRTLDHCAIYVLIAGTYTPFGLLVLPGAWRWAVLSVVWTMALLGIVYKLLWIGRWPRFSTFAYLGMGWVGVVAAKPLFDMLPIEAIALMLGGGLAYSLGTLIYHRDRVLRYGHALWHVCVLVGSLCHFLAISRHVLAPMSG